jgi:hypothetical protein
VAKRSQTEIDKSLLKERGEEMAKLARPLFSANKMQRKDGPNFIFKLN